MRSAAQNRRREQRIERLAVRLKKYPHTAKEVAAVFRCTIATANALLHDVAASNEVLVGVAARKRGRSGPAARTYLVRKA